jgi:hypothetical protein
MAAPFIDLPANLPLFLGSLPKKRRADRTQHTVPHQPAARADRIERRYDRSFGIEDKAGCLEINGSLIDEARVAAETARTSAP